MIQLVPKIPVLARQWRNDPEIMRWCRQYTPISEYAHSQWLERIEVDPSIKMFGIDSYGNPVGVCGFTSIDRHNRSAEFSLYICKAAQHNGYGRQALLALLEHGFNAFGFNRIWGETFATNPAMKIFLEVGMKHEGTLRESYFRDGAFIDSHIISILRRDFDIGSNRV